MTSLQFLAPSADPRPGKEGTVYGAGHITDFDADDYEYVALLRAEGKVAIIDPPPAAKEPTT